MNTNIDFKSFQDKVWTNTDTNERVEYNERSGYVHIYGTDEAKHDAFEHQHIQAVLNACDIAVSQDKHEVWVTINGNYQIFVPNTSFLSMVLTQLTYVPKAAPVPSTSTVITDSSQLVVGKHYADCQNKNIATILEFVKTDRDSNTDYFKYVSGVKTYPHWNKDLLEFSCDGDWHTIN